MRQAGIGGGLYTVYGEETAITPRYLAEHPEFADNYPFDGIVLPAQLSDQWVAGLGLTSMGNPLHRNGCMIWFGPRNAIPEEAVCTNHSRYEVDSAQELSDNFMIYGMVDGARGSYTPP